MPELPEVETVRRGLAVLVPPGTAIARIVVRRRDLRSPVPRGLERCLAGQPILGFRRWGKYLLWDTPEVALLSHLGMSGTWREAPAGAERIHDHCYVVLGDGRRLAYRDPRRFGLLDFVRRGDEGQHPLLAVLGPDPLSPSFDAAYLGSVLARRKAPVKGLLLDQRLIAGLGNIYVAESLFRAGIRPERPGGAIPRARLHRLVAAVRDVLDRAIQAGGSTLRDFRQAGGESGYFQTRFQVYGREGLPCLVCDAEIRGVRLGGRASAYCPRCQR